MAGKKGRSGGHNRKSLEEHERDGTFRPDRHAALLPEPEIATRPDPTPRVRCGRPEKWIRDASDELAIRNGAWFDEKRAAFACDWVRDHLCFSDSIWAGQPFELQEWQRAELFYPLFGWHRVNERGAIVRRFNQVFAFLPKKNGKSTTCAALGLYQLCAEGRRGDEIYSCGTDRDSASIVHNEAIKMVESSPNLSAFLKINYSTKAIIAKSLQSVYRALSARPAGSEGLKGSTVICDELHAWANDELWNSLKYAGVNWPERLRLCITTAGDSTESVCYREYQRAKAIASGTLQDDRLLVCIHEAQPDEDIHDPDVQKRANPSLGVTISAADLKHDIEEAERSPRTLAVLNRYRFNRWIGSSNPWLDALTWSKARDTADDAELIGLPCVAALDLARIHDTSAFALLFRRDADYLLRVWYWLPRPTAQKLSHLISYADWAEAGWIKLIDSPVAEYDTIEKDIIELVETYQPRELAFDPHYCEEISQRIAGATGIERIAFPQTITAFGGPTAAFERLLISGELRHDGNPVLAWQASNVQVKSDVNNNIRPIKPSRNSPKTVDGIVTGIMALGRTLAEPMEVESVYTQPAAARPLWA